jgi:hypothetical protein
MDMLIGLKSIPLPVWFGAAAVVIILIGWYFNLWRGIGVKVSFPNFEIVKPIPESHSIESRSLVACATLILHGDKLEAFDPRSSRVVIGGNTALRLQVISAINHVLLIIYGSFGGSNKLYSRNYSRPRSSGLLFKSQEHLCVTVIMRPMQGILSMR